MLSKEEIEENIVELNSGWEVKDGKVVKAFQFSSFMNAIGFVNEIAKVAERLDHHPIITINWKTVKLSLKSFDVDAITRRDIALAKDSVSMVCKKQTDLTLICNPDDKRLGTPRPSNIIFLEEFKNNPNSLIRKIIVFITSNQSKFRSSLVISRGFKILLSR